MSFLLQLLSANSENLIWASIVVSLVFGLWLIAKVLKNPGGDEKMQEIAGAIQVGAAAYLQRQYSVVAVVALIIAAFIIGSYLLLAFDKGPYMWDLPALAVLGFIGAGIFGTMLFISILREGR